MIQLVRFRTILILQLFSRVHPLVNLRLFRENYVLNFRTRSLPILFIRSNDTTHAISRNSMAPTFFLRALALFNLPVLMGASFLNFCTRMLLILFIWPNDATGAISHNSETATIFVCALTLVNLPSHPSAVLFDF